MREMVLSEVLDSKPSVGWDQIAGLERAKQVLQVGAFFAEITSPLAACSASWTFCWVAPMCFAPLYAGTGDPAGVEVRPFQGDPITSEGAAAVRPSRLFPADKYFAFASKHPAAVCVESSFLRFCRCR